MRASIKQLLLLFGVLILLVSVPLTVYLTRQRQELRGRATTPTPTPVPATTDLSLEPASLTRGIGETFTLEAKINTGQNQITAAELYITFAPDKLEGVQIQKGTFLEVELVRRSITQGVASITLGSQPSEPKQGTGTLAQITFRTKASGTTQVSYSQNTQVAAIGAIGSVVRNRASASVTISQAGGTPSPTLPTTPTPSPSPTRSPTPSLTLTPSPTLPPGATGLTLAFTLQGIQPTANLQDPSREVQVEIFDVGKRLIKQETTRAVFERGVFRGTLNLGNNFPSGNYAVKLRVPNLTLKKQVEEVSSIRTGGNNSLPEVGLFSGDLNNDNELNAIDYANLISCLGQSTPNCLVADFNGDGTVDTYDLSILIFNFSHREGD